MPLSLTLYRLGVALLEPFTPAILKGRAKRGKEDPARLGERLGRTTSPRPAGPLVWIHAVSVGESLSVLPLIARLRERRPETTVLVTSGTVTSATLLATRLPAGALHQYAPLDTPGAAGRFLDHWRPDLTIFVESEFWPNLILGAEARHSGLVLLSARVTEKTAKGWARATGLAKTVLNAFDLILPQDRDTEARLTRFGVAGDGRLNLKYVGEPLTCDEAELARLKALVGDRKIVLAASTHDGEEAIVVSAFQALPTITPAPLLIVAPRHPERGGTVTAMLRARGLTIARRSTGEQPGDGVQVYVADTLGEMGLLFRLADVAVMGGSFIDGVGGHNPLEPARLGVPAITGPHAFNFTDIYREMMAEQAALLVDREEDLTRLLQLLLTDAARARHIGAAGRAFARARSAALDEAWDKLEPLLP